MIYKRGAGKINRSRIPLVNNEVIEKELSKFGVICMEDLINEIAVVGPHFKEVNNFLWPFKLNSPKKGYRLKRIHYLQGGDYGNREDKINELVQRMI